MPKVPGFIRAAVGLTSGLVLLSAGTMAVLALVANDRPAWTLFGFELIIAIACAFGLVLGRFREAPGLAAACVAGTVIVGSVLGYLSLNPRVLGGVGLMPFLAGRVAAAGLIAAGGGYCVLSRHPRSWGLFARGLLLGLPVLGALAVAMTPALRGLLAPVAGLGVVGQMSVAVGLFLVLGVCLCASVDALIRAFELGRSDDQHPAGQAGGVTRA